MTDNRSSMPLEWLTRPGEMLLTIYVCRRHWFRLRSRWSLDWRYNMEPPLDGGEFSITLAEGWCSPRWSLTEIRSPGTYRELLG